LLFEAFKNAINTLHFLKHCISDIKNPGHLPVDQRFKYVSYGLRHGGTRAANYQVNVVLVNGR
jgi:hypothetical protein